MYVPKVLKILSILLIISPIIISNITAAYDFELITTVSGDSAGDKFYKIANGRGDVNNDGYQDVLIGAPFAGGANWIGLVKLFYGSAEFDTIPDLIIHGVPAPSYYGVDCSIIGDVNNDGYDDILVSNSAYFLTYPLQGIVYLYFGGSVMDSIPDLSFIGDGWYYNLGGHVSGAGDVNGDGYDDWLINAINLYPRGYVYLYLGGEEPDSIPDLIFEKNYSNTLEFDSPALGDVNGDGYDDILLYDSNCGDVELHCGGAHMDTIPELRWTDNFFGKPVCGVGDVNNDGFNDWLIRPSSNLFLYFGSFILDTIPDLILSPEEPCNWFKDDVAGGDINGDRVNDIVIGGYIGGYPYSGQVLGYLGGHDIDEHYDYFYDSEIPYEILGETTGLADIDGDNICEVLAGASQNDAGPGRVWFLAAPQMKVPPRIYPVICREPVIKNSPNPFNPTTALSYKLQASSFVNLVVYDIAGRQVAELVNGWRDMGQHEVTFDGSNLASGVYIYCLELSGSGTTPTTETGKMVLVK